MLDYKEIMHVAEMCMLWMRDNTRRIKVKNDDIFAKKGIAPIKDRIQENHLWFFDHMQRKPMDASVQHMELINQVKRVNGHREKQKQKQMEIIRKDMIAKCLNDNCSIEMSEEGWYLCSIQSFWFM